MKYLPLVLIVPALLVSARMMIAAADALKLF